MTAVPQRPLLTFAVGITGHRPNKLPAAAAARAASQLAAVFKAIDAACVARREQDARLYREGAHRVRLVSSFAEGVDQIAVKMRPAGWEVAAVLPFSRERYEQDFVTRDEKGAISSDHRPQFKAALAEASGVVELPEASDGAPAAYARAGAFSLRQIDILVAVWDGAEAAGKGGTADVVAQALDGGIPVIWIASTREQAPWLIERLADVERDTPLADATLGPIAEAVDAALAVPAAAARRLKDFLDETWCHGNGWTAHEALGRFPRSWTWWRKLPARCAPGIPNDWPRFLESLPDGGGFRGKLQDLLLPRYAAADARATHFAQACRGASVLVCVLASVAIALVGVLALGLGPWNEAGDLAFKAALTLLELVIVGTMIWILRRRLEQCWHERRRDYRAAAELLRHLRFLAPVGECASQHFQCHPAPTPALWVLWYLRATIREIGCPHALIDASYQRKVLLATQQAEIEDGAGWHRFNPGADRSAKTAAALQSLKSDYALALERPDLDRTAVTLLETARVLAKDLEGWQPLYRRKRLTLPV